MNEVLRIFYHDKRNPSTASSIRFHIQFLREL
jgi:hypothetical protein